MKDAKTILKRIELWEKIGKWAGLIIFLFIGTVMIFGMHHWEKPIGRQDAIPAEASYLSCTRTYGRYTLKEILVRFSDLDRQAIDSAYATESLYDEISALEPGTRVSLLLHPNSAIILDMRVGDRAILEFDHAVKALRREVVGFTVLGVMLYLGAVGCGIALLPRETRRKLRLFPTKSPKNSKDQRKAARQILRVYFKRLYEMLLAGMVLSALVLITGFLAGGSERHWLWLWMSLAVFLIFLLIPIRQLLYWVRVRRELRHGQAIWRSVCVREIREDRKERLRRAGDDWAAYLLVDTSGTAYRFAIDPSIQGYAAAPIGRRLVLTFLPDTGFLLSVVPYLHKKEEKAEKKQFRGVFSLYLTEKYEYET